MEDDCAEAERRDRAQVTPMSGQVARVLDPQHEQRIDVRFFQCRLAAGQPFPPHAVEVDSLLPVNAHPAEVAHPNLPVTSREL